jgi:hypothetical protein
MRSTLDNNTIIPAPEIRKKEETLSIIYAK